MPTRPLDARMRIGGSTYSKEPFPKQVRELRELGFDYAEMDLTHVTLDSAKLRELAIELAGSLPLETAHLPPSHFRAADLARFVGLLDALGPVGTQIFNVHFLPARAAPAVSAEVRIAWLTDLVRAAEDRGVLVTLENVEETTTVLRRVLDALSDLRFCLDIGHAHLEGRGDGARAYLLALGDRLSLVHAHDNHRGHGEPGDEHLPLGKGINDVERDMREIRRAGYDGRVTLEIFKGTPDDKRASLRKMRRWSRP